MTAAATPALGIGAVATPADSLHTITLDLFASDDTGEVAGKALLGVQQLIAADTVSLWVPDEGEYECRGALGEQRDLLSLIHISEPTRLLSISYAVFCLKKK